ncbi:MAG: DUF4317 domain-containing protein [Clostridiales bacterium]|nr:DUF4317 domain-containing protein [Clostridiales bacterium]MDD7386666.1 DUF4317 domain-containing protein [Bacillota bacterium]MDY6041432.1 DUF4317 domain-containing protein [Candidatus Faecousia sp.]
MNDKEIGEIRRHLRRDRSNMTTIYGCYVNAQKEIISEFSQSLGIMPENESEKYFALLKRTLSGTLGKNLIDISFKTSQVAGSPEHQLLMDLRQTRLKDDELRRDFYQKIIDSVSFEDSYLILLGCDSYDVPFKSKDDSTQADQSEEVYTYLVCAICPVKQTKPNLHYVAEEKLFHDGAMAQMVSAPQLGFLFPAFDNRATNIYNALFYSRDIKDGHDTFIETIFNTAVPKPAAEQKQSFEALLSASLDDECGMEVVQEVHNQLRQRIEMHKEAKVPEPLMISKEDVKQVLKDCGVSEAHMAKFSVDYDEAFGFEAELHPRNIIDDKHFEIKTPDVSIKVAPDRSDLIETRVIGGVKYILICADENVEVNGVSIQINDKEPATV